MHFRKITSNDFGKFYCTNVFETLIASVSDSLLCIDRSSSDSFRSLLVTIQNSCIKQSSPKIVRGSLEGSDSLAFEIRTRTRYGASTLMRSIVKIGVMELTQICLYRYKINCYRVKLYYGLLGFVTRLFSKSSNRSSAGPKLTSPNGIQSTRPLPCYQRLFSWCSQGTRPPDNSPQTTRLRSSNN